MATLGNPQNTIAVLQKYSFNFQKKFGQNFLIDTHVLDKIVAAAGITKDDFVLEIGPGIGTMTQYLCENARQVLAVEIDKMLIPILEDTLSAYDNVEVLNEDILKVDIKRIAREKNSGRPIKVVANLPYYITTPIIMGLFESHVPMESITVMVQKEVAERMQVGPGTKEYGALSLAVQYYAKPEIVANVPPNCFMPRPKVGSAVIRLTRHEKPPVEVADEQLLFRLIRASFNQRRKTLVNGLSNSGELRLSKEQIAGAIEKLGLSPSVRGEALTLEQFARLSNIIGDMSRLTYISKEPIDKGWSGDKKYCITDKSGTQYLLRISDMARYEAKQSEFNRMKQVAALGVPMCTPVEFGTCEEGVYSIQKWIEGVNADSVITTLPEDQQYAYGLDAGKMLRMIHSIPAPETQEAWEIRFNRKMDLKIQKYRECPIKYENGQAFIDFINENRHLLKDRPQVYQHGDYHIGNMIIDTAGKLNIIDFDRNDYGDPWEEFNRIVWCAQKSPLFASGMVKGYFEGDVPLAFWKLLALYISSNTLSSVYWAIPYGQQQVDTMLNQAREVLSWYDNMRSPVPDWFVCLDK